MTDVAVIGGGIAGASVAYHLSELSDASVTVFERGSLAGETTARSAAFFGFYGSEVERRLKRYGMALYNEFLAEPRAEPRHQLVGRVRVATTGAGAEQLAERVEQDSDVSTGGAIVFDSARSLRERVLLPELDPASVVGASYRAGVGYHQPRALAREFAARATERGVEIRTEAGVADVVVEGDRVRELVVEDDAGRESLEPRAVVCAAGPWNHEIAGFAGLDLPVSHSLAPIVRLDRPSGGVHTLPILSHLESGVYVRGDGPDAVLAGHYPTERDPARRYDPDDVGDEVPTELRERIGAVVADLLPALTEAPASDEWVGVRSHTPDGHPVVGWSSVEGLSVVCFDSSGIQHAPAAGRIVAEQLVEGEPTDHYRDVTISRFDGFRDRRFTV